ncbi:hypothetical protein Tco_0735987 [Tanacetum coccineum]
MDDPNMTMKEYIKLEKEKARRRGRVFNWETATYGKIRVDNDLHDLRYVEAKFPAIVINDTFAPQDALPCESQVSTPVNDEIDFRISFDEFDNEDYAIIWDKNSFSYKMISVNNLKMDSENDNEKAGIPSFPLPKPTISYVDDLDFLKILRMNFQPLMLLCFIKNLYVPFGIQFDPKRYYKDGDCTLMLRRPRAIRHMAPLPPREQRHLFLRYGGLEYTDADVAEFEERMVMGHRDDAGVVVFTSRAWGKLFDTRGLLVWEFILEFLSTLIFREVLLDLDAHDTIQFQLGGARRRLSWRYWSESERMIPGKRDLHDYWRSISTDGDFLGPPPSYTLIRDLMLRLCHRMMIHNIAGRSQAPKRVTMTDLRKSGAHIFGEQFVVLLAQHFRLLTTKILRGLTVITPKLLIIDMAELEEDVYEICRTLAEQHDVISAMAYNFFRFYTWTTTSLARMIDRAGLTYTSYSETLREYMRHMRCRTGEANTSTAQQGPQQPDP